MRYLLDTGIWLWSVTASERISSEARALLESHPPDLYLSAASVWEIAIKWALGKLDLPNPPVQYLPRILSL